ncbi:MAG: beta-lactamase family protein [Candidatus Aminicenantes bacterium]|nr:beta-lactamase family protein [Candidatus Aminicenantes bacterium]
MRKINRFGILPLMVLCSLSFLFLGYVSAQRETGNPAAGEPQKQAAEKPQSPAAEPLKTKINTAELIAQLEKEIPQLMEKGLIPGLSAAVIRDGKLAWAKGFGVKDTKTEKPVTQKSVFEAASLSKAVFAYAVLKLVEKGTLDLDKPLMQYVTESYIREKFSGTIGKDERLKKITARMVMSHSCGFPNWRNGELNILFTPGEKFSYSGEGFVFLQRVVEKLTGKKLEDFMREMVFQPLGMTESSFVWEKKYEEQSAAPHDYLLSKRLRRGSRGNAAHSLKTTASDYARFMLAIMNEQGLEKETLQEMLKPQVKLEKMAAIFWGLGVGLQHTDQGEAYWHWGDNGDFKAFFIAFKKEKLGVVYFTNCTQGLSIATELVRAALGGEHPVISSPLMSYDRHDSPGVQLMRTYLKKGIAEVIKNIKEKQKDPARKKRLSEVQLRRLGRGLLDIEAKEAAFKIFSMNLDAFPRSYNAHKDLAGAYLQKAEWKQARFYYKKALSLRIGKKTADADKSITWALEYIKAIETPAVLSRDYLKTMVGDYGERHIKLENGSLYYFRENAANKDDKKLYPLSKDIFILKDPSSFRLRFVFDEKGIAKKIIGMYEGGRHDESPRSAGNL